MVRPDSKTSKEYVRESERVDHIVSKLHTLIARYLLRRTKAEAQLSLPPKVEALVYTPLTPAQVALLRGVKSGSLSAAVAKLDWQLVRARVCGRVCAGN